MKLDSWRTIERGVAISVGLVNSKQSDGNTIHIYLFLLKVLVMQPFDNLRYFILVLHASP